MTKTRERILIGATIIALLIAVAIPLTAMAAGSGHVDTFYLLKSCHLLVGDCHHHAVGESGGSAGRI